MKVEGKTLFRDNRMETFTSDIQITLQNTIRGMALRLHEPLIVQSVQNYGLTAPIARIKGN
ncbi:hypothetical protein [Rhodohalobacter sp.]|uniref:hypothetical protein n=1 Tax=Rhodohalobacter sp. TaxID=1974210 RepID=UPI003562F899